MMMYTEIAKLRKLKVRRTEISCVNMIESPALIKQQKNVKIIIYSRRNCFCFKYSKEKFSCFPYM